MKYKESVPYQHNVVESTHNIKKCHKNMQPIDIKILKNGTSQKEIDQKRSAPKRLIKREVLL